MAQTEIMQPHNTPKEKMKLPPSALPFGSQLSKDYVQSFPAVAEFFYGDYRLEKLYHTLASRVDQTPRADRGRLIEILTEQNESFGGGAATRHNLRLLAKPDSLAVVTGQQVGLFSGPLYTLYKALTTCKLAADLTHRLDRPVLPVFYLVSEDHDFDEVRWVGWWDKANQFQKLVYTPARMPQRLPMSEVLLEPGIELLLQDLQDWTPPSEFKSAWMDVLARCYHPGTSMATAFAHFFSHLLAEWGVVLLNASDPRLKELAQPIFQQELNNLTSVSAIQQTNVELMKKGYHTQLTVHPTRPHLFVLNQGRHSLEKERDRFVDMHSRTAYTSEELLQQPSTLSPKAALRPIVQDWLLPTLAYVAGPGEIAYWAQLKRAYAGFGLPMPMVVPRAGFTLVEPKIQRHLEKFSLTSAEVIAQGKMGRTKVEARLLPPTVMEQLNELRQLLAKKWPDLSSSITALDATLLSPSQKTEAQINAALQQLENRVVRALQQKEAVMADQLQAIYASLWPGDELQERQANILPFLVKYGPAILTLLYQQIDWQAAEHQIIHL